MTGRAIAGALQGGVMLLVGCGSRTVGEGASSLGETSPQETSAGSTAESAEGTATSETGEPQDCEPILQGDGSSTGYLHCMLADVIVRVDAAVCSDPFPPGGNVICGAGYGVCSTDADCTDAPYGTCGFPSDIIAACHCEYGCMSDADCSAGKVCMCSPVDVGTGCIEAACRTDADCAPGYRCALSSGESWFSWGLPSLHCHGPNDLCQGDADCPDSYCKWQDTRWECAG